MALHDDEMNIRRQRREEMKQKRLKEQRRLKIALICAAVLLVGYFILSLQNVEVAGKIPPAPP